MASSFDRFLRRAVPNLLRSAVRAFHAAVGTPAAPGSRGTAPGSRPAAVVEGRPAPYPGDFTGTAHARYSPQPDGRPDPG
ncbi:MAG TPA: type II toxin-antitoxin system PemK/MazF family toxin, partial [Micrococcaceae bacterium]